MPIAPLAVAALAITADVIITTATRVVIIVVTADAIVTAATHVKQAIPQLKQGWREARRQRALLKNPRLEHKHGIE